MYPTVGCHIQPLADNDAGNRNKVVVHGFVLMGFRIPPLVRIGHPDGHMHVGHVLGGELNDPVEVLHSPSGKVFEHDVDEAVQ